MSSSTKLTPEVRTRFLELYATNGRMTESAHAVGVQGSTIARARKKDKEFDEQTIEAYAVYRDHLESVLEARALVGVLEPIFHKGVLIGHKANYSDALILAHAKKHIPEYREKQSVDVNHSGGVLVVPGVAKDSHAWERSGNSGDAED